MTKRMLVDAAYPEETRVVVLDNDQLIEFDYETTSKQQLKGNIYLAKVTRVEPSLQAAFVEYGGNRHGFLAFSEIHPDYYQIPQADRERLTDLEGQIAALGEPTEDRDDDDGPPEGGVEPDPEDGEANGGADSDADPETTASVAKLRRERSRMLRQYKIQEVIKRRQIMLVQVMKEERGSKGAALTTFMSLAGRYCVLMPNTPRGGGISRKISTQSDRSRLKDIAQELKVPSGMGLIIRTAGQERNKAEIRRDYDYLLRLWEDIRMRTLESIAPCVIHEEATLIKRAMRDLYTSDIEEVLVEGDVAYRTAKQFMTMLMPSRARRVKQYKDETPVFSASKVEDLLDLMHDPMVRLKSGGSIVISPTEALTAIDVNSGKSTRERHIDETAVKTNLEAAEEIARQMRLRDIAGLVVIDFIDMSEHRHQRQVEKRLRDALKADRARLQVGRISGFGLLELSRQRLRPSFLELSSQACPVCQGSGTVRSIEGAALQALRKVEAVGLEGKAAALAMSMPLDVALYVINQKRADLSRLEDRYRITVEVRVDAKLIGGQVEIDVLSTDRGEVASAVAEEPAAVVEDAVDEPETDASAAASGDTVTALEEGPAEDGGRKRRRRRRRRRRDGEGEVAAEAVATEPAVSDVPVVAEAASTDVADATPAADIAAEAVDDEPPAKPARRRRRRRPASEPAVAANGEAPSLADDTVVDAPPLLLPELEGSTDEAPESNAEALVVPVPDVPDSLPEAVETSAVFGAEDKSPIIDTASPAAAEEAAPVPLPNGKETAGDGVDEEPAMAAAAPKDTPLETRPGVVVDSGDAADSPRREGWWSRLTRRS